MLQALKNISGEFPSTALLEESMARGASREDLLRQTWQIDLCQTKRGEI